MEGLPCRRHCIKWFLFLTQGMNGSRHSLAPFTTWHDLNSLFVYLFSVSSNCIQCSMKASILSVLVTAASAGCYTVLNNYFLDDWMDEFYRSFMLALLDGKYGNYHTHPIYRDMRLQNGYRLGNQNQIKILLLLIITMLYWVLTIYNSVC